MWAIPGKEKFYNSITMNTLICSFCIGTNIQTLKFKLVIEVSSWENGEFQNGMYFKYVNFIW